MLFSPSAADWMIALPVTCKAELHTILRLRGTYLFVQDTDCVDAN